MKSAALKEWFSGFLVTLLFWAGVLTAQDPSLISAVYQVTNAPDTAGIKEWMVKASHQLASKAYDSADHFAGRAFDLSRQSFFRPGKATSQYILGQSAMERGSSLAAIRYFFGALSEYGMMRDTAGMARTNLQIGRIYRQAELHSKAIEYFLTAEKLADGRDSAFNAWDMMSERADSYFQLQQYGQAVADYQRLLEHFQAQRENDRMIPVMSRLIQCYLHLDQFEKSIDLNDKLLSLFRSKGDRRQELIILNNAGFIHQKMGSYRQALQYFDESLNLQQTLDPDKPPNPVILLNQAVIHQNLGDYPSAIQAAMHAVRSTEKTGGTDERALLYHILANIYFLKQDFYNARVNNNLAQALALEIYDQQLLSDVYYLASRIDEALYDFEPSFEYYRKYLNIRDSLARTQARKQEEMIQQRYIVERAEKEIAQMLDSREIRDLELIQLRLESKTQQQQLEILRKNDSLQKAIIENQQLEQDKTLQELLLAEERLATERKDREIEDLKQREEIQTLEIQKKELAERQNQQEIALLTKDKELGMLALSKARSRNYFMLGISLLALTVLYAVYRGLRFAKRANWKLARQNVEINRQKEEINQNLIIIDEERRKSDTLLLNILPAETAAELKEKGQASPRHYEMVTILFTDFVGFTFVAERMTPQELIAELNHCFLEFDRIIDRYGVEKIKTIGDSYMCAGGIPVASTTNPVDVVSAAIEIRDFVSRTRQERLAAGKDYWEVRIGVNTGPVMAGVVGKNKFAYDIWGDAVNIASRMESSGKSGMVNISGTTYQLVKDQFHCTYRGKIQAKNKGEVDMYFADKIKEQKTEIKNQN